MAGDSNNKKTGVRILFGVVIGLLAVSMLLYLVPQGPNSAETSSDVVARVGDQTVTLAEVHQKLDDIRRNNNIPKQVEALYARQILDQLVFQKEVEYEAKRMGITVSEKERADRIRMYVPTAFNGDTFVGMDAYAREVQQRFQMSVPVFEDLVRTGLVEEKFRKLITDGISVGLPEIQDEFRYENEKVKLDYVLIKPDDLLGRVNADDSEVKAYYDKNKANFQIPEKRAARYALLDLAQLRQSVPLSDDELQTLYQQNIQQYQVPNRVHVEHILLFTTGKTDAEVEEIRKKALDILGQAKKKGANFEELAKKYSEDPGSKAKGGDLGWLMQGQTVPEFEKAAFSLNKGEMSGLIRTQYGFHIIKVLDKETAHTTPFEEVKDSIRAPLLLQKVDAEAGNIADKMSAEIRQSNKTTLDGLAQKYHLSLAESRPVAANEPLLELGNSQEVKDQLFRLRQGDLSLPIRTDRGYVVISVQQILPTHQGTLEEVREKVLTELKQQKAAQLAQARAKELERRVKAGEKFAPASKALGFDPKTSEMFARSGSVPGLGSGKQLSAAFTLKSGEVGSPLELSSNWAVYQVVEKTEANPADFEKQKKTIADTLVQSKRTLAFEAFRTALEERMKKEGTLKLMPEKMRGFGDVG
ncbi:MAG TPA: peptidyl-prolyl cis-trans isomerase [Candidatus Acidoferrum sp.]|nr:peptidyl-prolyl cis-trans isomerase [Candidatus Acidoferrum sp.]